MVIEITISEFNVLKTLNGVMEYLSDIAMLDNGVKDKSGVILNEGEVHFTISEDDLSKFKDDFYFNIVEEGMDREGKVNEYGKQLYKIYDKILSQTNRYK